MQIHTIKLADGTEVKRTSLNRTYTHVVLVNYHDPAGDTKQAVVGWASNYQLAQKAATHWRKRIGTQDYRGWTYVAVGTPICQVRVHDVKHRKSVEGVAAQQLVQCPGCSGTGTLTDDPQILKCDRCGGLFTDWREPITQEQALKFVALHLPMLANAGPDGSFYFDLDIRSGAYPDCRDGRRRVHGWADQKTRRVVQFG